jgi:hypothetical protein
MTKEQLLDKGVLPENDPYLSTEEVRRWMNGMRKTADLIHDSFVKEHTDFLKCITGKRDISDELFESSAALSDWCKTNHQELFGIIPNVSIFLDTLTAEPLGFSSLNQCEGKNWESAEYFLVANNNSIANFGWLDGPYNVEVGKGVEREKGCKRKVWVFDITGIWNVSERFDLKQLTDRDVSKKIWKMFCNGKPLTISEKLSS